MANLLISVMTLRGEHINLMYELMITGTILIIGLSIAVYLYQLDKLYLIYYNDAISHLVRGRELVDSAQPGLEQIGTGWLPLVHFLLLPFSLIESLFKTGFAGLVVSLPSLAISALFLYRIIRFQIGITFISIAGAFLYAFNPNMLYLGIIAMTEVPFMLFFIISAYYFQRYLFIRSFEFQSDSRILRSRRHEFYTYGLNDLIKCSLFVSLATLCKYEAWIIPIFLVPYVVISVLRQRDKVTWKPKVKMIERIFPGNKTFLVYSILISLLSFSGIALWMSYNAFYFNDPLEFQNAQFWSASWFAKELGSANTLFLNPSNVASEYILTAVMIYGPVALIGALMGFLSDTFLRKQRLKQLFSSRVALYIYLILPALVVPISLLIGNAELNTRHEWFNSRYLILLSPIVVLLCSVFIAILYNRLKAKQFIAYALIGTLFLSQFAIASLTIVTFYDGQHNKSHGSRPFVMETAEALKSRYTTGKVLIITGSAQQNNIMQAAGIPLNNFDTVLSGKAWKASFKEPWLYDNYIIISKKPDASAADESKYWLDRQNVLDQYYDVVYENKYYEVMVKKGVTKN